MENWPKQFTDAALEATTDPTDGTRNLALISWKIRLAHAMLVLYGKYFDIQSNLPVSDTKHT